MAKKKPKNKKIFILRLSLRLNLKQLTEAKRKGLFTWDQSLKEEKEADKNPEVLHLKTSLEVVSFHNFSQTTPTKRF